MMFFDCNLSSLYPLKCISMNNQECNVRPQIVNVNRHEPLFFLLVLKQVNAVVFATILIIHTQNLRVPDVAKNINLKAFNLISRTNKARHVKWHETCKCKCRLDAGVCNNKKRWNQDKYRCECKKLIDKGACDK